MTQTKFFKHKNWSICISILVCACILILILLQTSFKDVTKKLYPELYAWNIIPKSEMFTELYFENHEKLPTYILPQQEYSFSFTIHNMEYKNMTYPYSVYLLTNNTKIVLQDGSVSLQQNQKRTIPVRIHTDESVPTSEIVVDLPKKNQSIDFWVHE